jgi:hypothetical protein
MGGRDKARNAGVTSPLKPTRRQATAERAITPVAGTNARSTPPMASPSGDPPVSKVERAPKTLPSWALGTLRCSKVVSIGVYGPRIKPPSKRSPQAGQRSLTNTMGRRLAPQSTAISGKATPRRRRLLRAVLLKVPRSAPTARADGSYHPTKRGISSRRRRGRRCSVLMSAGTKGAGSRSSHISRWGSSLPRGLPRRDHCNRPGNTRPAARVSPQTGRR